MNVAAGVRIRFDIELRQLRVSETRSDVNDAIIQVSQTFRNRYLTKELDLCANDIDAKTICIVNSAFVQLNQIFR